MTAEAAFNVAAEYLYRAGWYQDGQDPGLWLPDGVTFETALGLQLDREGFSPWNWRPEDDGGMTVREALIQLATPEPEPFAQVYPSAADDARWQRWRDRTTEALLFARALPDFPGEQP